MVFAYFDSCIWLSALIRRDSKHPIALSLFEQVKKGNYTILVNHYVLSEILETMKEKLVTHHDVRTNPVIQVLETLTKEKYREFSNTLLKLTNVKLKDPNVMSYQILKPSFDLLFKYFGSIVEEDTCPICRNPKNFIGVDGICESDALHALLALHLNCDIFFTFDKDFLPLINDSIISPMQIKVL
jgi:predicted nucleic acid-binding protein